MKKTFLLLVSLLPAAVVLAGRFEHPGIGLNREQLDQLKKNVQEGVEPWKSLYADLTAHDQRFSKKPRIFTRRGEGISKIDNPDFDTRCAWDSQTVYCQAVMYEITGKSLDLEWMKVPQ